jgi:diacylglycerol kinase family enzyme
MASQPQATLSPAGILNGKSVHLQSAVAHIGRISRELGADPQVVVTKRSDDIPSMAARALAEHHQPIVAGGGDSTVNAIVGKLAGTDIALGKIECV